MKSRFYAITAALLLTCSCKTPHPGGFFLETSEPCLVIKEYVVHRYDPLTWQLGFNPTTKEFRVYNDTMTDYFILKCNELPKEPDQEISGDLKWSGSSIKERRNLTLTVEKMDAQGNIWLWNRKNDIAVCVRTL